MSSIDERIVRMQFENKQFESGVSTTLSSLEKLKKGLDFEGATESFDEINKKADSTDLSGIQKAIETIKERFNAMGIIGITVLQNITNAAISTGSALLKSITVQPLIDGFREYETQIGAIQTILANTQSKGSTLNDVNTALDTLNTYADKTIYNFTEMTRNIGTFTAAGVDLQTSVDSIQGIANLAAVSGSTSMQASTAMYQLSQAIAAGTVKLMDWNSVVNAGMGGQVFQDALIRTSEHLNTGAKAAINAQGSFRESLQTGWLTTEVLTETLRQFSLNVESAEDYERAVADLVAQGYTQEEAKNIADMARTAADAATKVKTFSQLIDTLKEALGSGWTQSWELIIGDFEEAKDLYTKISDTLSNIINETAKARNSLLSSGLSSGWKQLLEEGINDEQKFIDTTKEVARQHGVAVDDIINKSGSFSKSLKEGWASSNILSESISKMANEVRGLGYEELKAKGYTESEARALIELDNSIKNGSVNIQEYANKMSQLSGRERLVNALSNAWNGLYSTVKAVKDAFREVFPAMTGDQLYGITEAIEAFSERLKPTEQTLDQISRIAKGFFSALHLVKSAIEAILGPIGRFIGSEGVGGFASSILEVIACLGDFVTALDEGAKAGEVFSSVSSTLDAFFNTLSNVLGVASAGFSAFTSIIKSLASAIKDILGGAIVWLNDHISFGDFGAMLAGTGIVTLASSFKTIADKILEITKAFSGVMSSGSIDSIKESLVSLFAELGTVLQSFTRMINVGSLLGIAVAVTVLVFALKTLVSLDLGLVIANMPVLIVLMLSLVKTFTGFIRTIRSFQTKGTIAAAVALVLMAAAINILTDAMANLAGLSPQDIIQGLISVAALMVMINIFLKTTKLDSRSITAAASMLVIAEAVRLLASSVKYLGEMDFNDLAEGVGGLVVLLTSLVAAQILLSKFSSGKGLVGAISLVIMVKALEPAVEAIKTLGSLSAEQLVIGLDGMIAALGVLVGIEILLSNFSSGKGLVGAIAVLILSQALIPIGNTLQQIGSLSAEQLVIGLDGMTAALVVLAGIEILLSQISSGKGLVGAIAVLIMAQALKPIADCLTQLGSMSWEQVRIGLAAMGLALLEVAVITTAVGLIGGLQAALGAIAIYIVVQSLGDLASAFLQFASMSWEQLGVGLAAMGAALLVVAAITTGVGVIGGLQAALGAIAISMVVGSLDQLATALQKFASMSWEQIGQGLAAMSAAMTTVAIGSFLNTLSGFGAGALSTAAEALNGLADAFTKWQGISVPDDLPDQLGRVADGVGKFMFGALGAGTLSTVAPGLYDLAGAVAAWQGVSVPENIQDNLTKLATGVSAFTFSGLGGLSIGVVVDPLKNLVEAVKAWQGVSVPESIEDDLKKLANGVKAFTFSGFSSGGMSAVTEPLKNLADSARGWNGITIPEGIEDSLKSLANGAKSFTSINGDSLGSTANGLSSLSWSLGGFSNLNLGNAGVQIDMFAMAIQGIPDRLSGVSESISWSISSIAGVISASSGTFSSAGYVAAEGLGVGLSAGISAASWTAAATMSASMFTVISAGVSTLSGAMGQFMSLGLNITDAVRNGIQNGTSNAVGAVTNLMNSIKNSANMDTGQFYSVGYNIAEGLANGIRDGKSLAVNAAAEMARKAVEAAKKEAEVQSPSRKTYEIGQFMGIGLANGMNALRNKVERAGANMASSALSGLNSASATITPVISSDNAGIISGFSANRTLSINAKLANSGIVSPITAMQKSISSENAQVLKSNDRVVTALGDLREDMGVYTSNIENMEVAAYIDAKKVVSTIAKPMDKQLGTISRRRR